MSKQIFYTSEPKRFSRRWWAEQGRVLLWVAIITLLVWVYADMEMEEPRDFNAALELNTAGSANVMLISDPSRAISFRLRGNRSNLDRFARMLSERGGTIEYDISQSYGPGEHEVITRDVLLLVPKITQMGLTVVSASPRTISVELDHQLRKEVAVELDYKGATLAEKPKITPSRVEIIVAKSRWRQIQNQLPQDTAPVLRTRTVDLSTIAPNGAAEVTAEIIPSIKNVPVDPQTDTVTATVRVSQPTDTLTVTVTVGVVSPPTWSETGGTWDEYILKRKDPHQWRKEITISGPRTDLVRLSPEDVRAYITLTENDKKPLASWLSRKVNIRLPEGLNLKVLSEAPTVNFRLEKRQPDTPS